MIDATPSIKQSYIRHVTAHIFPPCTAATAGVLMAVFPLNLRYTFFPFGFPPSLFQQDQGRNWLRSETAE